MNNSLDIQWLDFFDELLEVDPDSTSVRLRPEFKMDDTHLNPNYCHLIESSINQIVVVSSK